jgi:hypothetical protein
MSPKSGKNNPLLLRNFLTVNFAEVLYLRVN